MRFLFIGCLCAAACARDQAAKPLAAARTTASVPQPAMAEDSMRNPTIPDSVLRRVAALEDSLSRDSTSPRAPALLWELGTLTRAQPQRHSRNRPLRRVRQGSCGAVCVLRLGRRVRVQRIPLHRVDPPISGRHAGGSHAAYALTQPRLRRASVWAKSHAISDASCPHCGTFLSRYPDSPLARDAVLRINAAFDSTLAFKPGPNDLWQVDSAGDQRGNRGIRFDGEGASAGARGAGDVDDRSASRNVEGRAVGQSGFFFVHSRASIIEPPSA